MQHLDEGTIHAWLDGALSAEEHAEAERHVRHCAACAALVAEARGMIAGAARIVGALDDVRGGVIPSASSSGSQTTSKRSAWRMLRLTPLRAGLAASLMVAAASMLAVRHERTERSAAPAPAQVLEKGQAVDSVRPVPLPAAVAAPAAPPPKPTARAPRVAKAIAAPTPAPVADNIARDAFAERAASPVAVTALSTGAGAMPDSTSAIADSFVGCYRVVDESSEMRKAAVARPRVAAASEAAPRAVAAQRATPAAAPVLAPYGFSLERPNVVRALDSGGRVDTVSAAASWRYDGRGPGAPSARVLWGGADGGQERALILTRSAGGLVARTSVAGRTLPARVVVVACRR